MPLSPAERGFLLRVSQMLLLAPAFFLSYGASELPIALVDGDRVDHSRVVSSSLVVNAVTARPLDGLPFDNSSLILAAERTHRRDPLNGYKRYSGGWNISEQHYWASVGFTAAPLFLIGAVWFLVFGMTLFLICCCYCCCSRRSYSYSGTAYAISLVMLILFTVAAIIGCLVLYMGQGKFHSSTSKTLDYVVGQANYTAKNLRNFSDSLAAAKTVRVQQVLLAPEIQAKIDDLQTKLNTSATDLAIRTNENSHKIQQILDAVRKELIIIAAVMLFLAFLGFLLSVLGLQFVVYILVLIGWILVAGTFILSGFFLLIHNVVADTCVAMDEWVQHPHAHTALDDILPCVDAATADASLYGSKMVTFHLVTVVNGVITKVSNRNNVPPIMPLYYNQSGPQAPLLCNPYAPDFSDRNCAIGEVDLDHALQVWQGYVCNASGPPGSEICTSVGRFTPDVYSQLTAATRVSFGLYHYSPFLAQLQDCSFLRDTFTTISSRDCPDLSKYSNWVYIGLTMVSGAVMLSLIFWVIYARESRHRRYSKQFLMRSAQVPQEKPPGP